MTNLVQRVITGFILVIIIVACVLSGRYGLLCLTMSINLLTVTELYRLLNAVGFSRVIFGIVLSISMLACVFFILTGFAGWKLLLINIPLVFSVFVSELYEASDFPFRHIAYLLLGTVCVTLPLCCLLAIAFFPPLNGIYRPEIILSFFSIIWLHDTGAYFSGKYFGRHRLFKRISPGKTWEGSIGGGICALSTAYLVSPTSEKFNWLMITIIIIITGTYADLVKSMLKRSLALKDSGNILPGHGGMLDRFDSVLGSAPFVYCYLILNS